MKGHLPNRWRQDVEDQTSKRQRCCQWRSNPVLSERPRAAGRQHLHSLHCSLSDPQQICWVGSGLNKRRRWSHKMSRENRSLTHFPTMKLWQSLLLRLYSTASPAIASILILRILWCTCSSSFSKMMKDDASYVWCKHHKVNYNFWVTRWHAVVVTPLCHIACHWNGRILPDGSFMCTTLLCAQASGLISVEYMFYLKHMGRNWCCLMGCSNMIWFCIIHNNTAVSRPLWTCHI